MRRIIAFIRRETVFCIAALCAAASSFFVPPSMAYLSYIDWNTLFILFALMAVIAAFRACGLFDRIAFMLCSHIHRARILSGVLVLLCFFTSMLITNDVALLTFVPFSLALLGTTASGRSVLLTVVLETVAANMGSMLTPLGNPQNLFLFSKMGLGIGEFVLIILPYCAASLVLLLLSLLLVRDEHLSPSKSSAQAVPVPQAAGETGDADGKVPVKGKRPLRERIPERVQLVIYAALFVLCLLCVLRLVPKFVAAASVLAVLLVLNRKVLASVDYMLLLTFTAFFIFTGNIAEIHSVRTFLEAAVSGHEFVVSVLCSQVISNVPATLLLYPFSGNVRALMTGVNIGGLGTLVASLASLISFKLYSGARGRLALPSVPAYFAGFSITNIIFLIFLCGLRLLLAL